MKDIFILGIETSCDDTCAAIIKNKKILSNIVKSQHSHKKYGGIVPELASREHIENINKVVEEAIKTAKIDKKNISAIAFTKGPGLMGSLLVGSMYAKGLSLGLNIPLIAINHLKGHIMSCCINNTVTFPFLCLLVSGGNTQIVIAKSYDDIELLGETLDDAIGEAYDKIAKMLNLEYPGGHLIDKYSQDGDINRFKFPKAKVQNLDFSFSGIKTAFKNFLKYNLEKDKFFVEKNFNHICASIQYTLIEMLTDKLELAIEQTKIKNISVGGGVANNNYLRKRLEELCMQKNLKLFLPEKQFCTDNAAMIAFLGYLKFMDKKFDNYYKDVNPDLKY